MKIKLAFSLLIVCALLLATSAWAATNATDLSWHLLGGGGGRLESGSVVVEGTLGQPVAGVVSQSPLELCSGFWCDAGGGGYKLFLPLLRR